MNCEMLHKEYKKLKTEETAFLRWEVDSQKIKSYKYIDHKDFLKVKELAKELTSHCETFVEKLSAADRYDLKKDIS